MGFHVLPDGNVGSESRKKDGSNIDVVSRLGNVDIYHL